MANAANAYHPHTVPITKEGLINGSEDEKNALRLHIDDKLMGMLKLLRGYDVVKFRFFSKAEQRDFKIRFKRIRKDIFNTALESIIETGA